MQESKEMQFIYPWFMSIMDLNFGSESRSLWEEMAKEHPKYRCSYNSITHFPFVQGVSLFSQLEDVYFNVQQRNATTLKNSRNSCDLNCSNNHALFNGLA